jgi:hypothetical protein
MEFQWLKDVEPGLKSLSYVLMEQKRNQWHNNGGRDYHIKFETAEAAGHN